MPLQLPYTARRLRRRAANAIRQQRRPPRWVAYCLDGPLVEFPPPSPFAELPGPIERVLKRFLPDRPPSVLEVRRDFEQLAGDPRIAGVLLRFGPVSSAAMFQSLRGLIGTLRAAGKQVVAWATAFGPFTYYLATACDKILMPPEAEWSVLGLEREYVFLKDALDWAGLGVEAVRVSPYKSAPDAFTRTDFGAEAREQAEWLLDEVYDTVVSGAAEARHMTPETMRMLMDTAPHSATRAMEAGLIDATRHEDELQAYLVSASDRKPELAEARGWRARICARLERGRERPVLQTFGEARPALRLPDVDDDARCVAVIAVDGTIIEGRSTPALPLPIPFIGDRASGSETIASLLRAAERRAEVAAIILAIDSPGGSALASDLIAREVRRIRARKPVVAFLNGVAASGGYYIAALANHIVAQPLTVTGSIGAFALKVSDSGLYERLRVGRTALRRGARAGLHGTSAPLDDDGRAAMAASISRVYDAFRSVVAEGRGLTPDALEPIAGGRVWTGAMAAERGLVDTLGDFQTAFARATELAKMPKGRRARLWFVQPPHRLTLPPPFPAATEVAREAVDAVETRLRGTLRTTTWARLPFDPGRFD